MQIRVISDLHIGVHGSKSNDFLFSDSEFARYLRHTMKRCDFLVLNGDVFELWERPIWQNQRQRLESILNSWPQIARLLREPSKKLILIAGNHDQALTKQNLLRHAKNEVTIHCPGGRTVYIAHGHVADAWCRPGTVASKASERL